MSATVLDTNSIEFDFISWLESVRTEADFWQAFNQLTLREKACVCHYVETEILAS